MRAGLSALPFVTQAAGPGVASFPHRKERPELRRFLEHASVKKGQEAFMTSEDMMQSLGVSSNTPKLKEFFRLADTTGDELISYAEYRAFLDLLNSPADSKFRLAFQLFDSNGDGKIDREEFRAVLANHTDESARKTWEGLEQKFFGEDKTELRYEEFVAYLNDIQNTLVDEEFAAVAQGRQHISTSEFLELLTNRGQSEQLYMKQLPQDMAISLEDFRAFHSLINHLPAISDAIELYTGAGGVVTRERFAHALAVTTGQKPTERELDLVFLMFCLNDEDTLDHKTFLMLMDVAAQRNQVAPHVLSVFESLTLAGVSAAIGATCVFPIDKIKTLTMSSHSGENILSSMATQTRIMWKSGIVRGYFGGLGPQLVGIMPEKALKLTVNDRLRKYLRGDDPSRELSTYEEMLAGMGTGCVQVAITTPYESAKIRMQIQSVTPGDKRSAFELIRQDMGFKGLYKGLSATLLRDVPFNIFFFSSSAIIKKMLRDEEGHVSPTGLLISGLGAGAVAAALDTPADMAKTRIQSGEYRNLREAIPAIYKEGGIPLFFRGVIPRVLIIGPLFSITFALFHILQEQLFGEGASTGVELLDQDIAQLRRARILQASRDLSDIGIKL